jgi:putative membrane protein
MFGIMNYGYGPMGFFGIFGFIFMIVFWALVIWLIVALVRKLSYHDTPWQRTERKTPLDILKERYAKGEINKEEFEEKKKYLSE